MTADAKHPWIERCVRGKTPLLLFALPLAGCGYFEQRLEDAGDMFYVSAGAAYGLSAAASIAPWEVSAGFSLANLYGWEGRSTFHRKELMIGIPPVFLQSLTEHVERSEGPWWRVLAEVKARSLGAEIEPLNEPRRRGHLALMPRELQPYTPRIFRAGLGLADYFPVYLTRDAFAPDTVPTEESFGNWGVGVSVTPGLFTVRIGMRPFGVINFFTGWLGFHLLSPYKPLSNELDREDLRSRGILPPGALQDPLPAIVSDLRSNSPIVRAYAAKVLGVLGEKARDHLEALRPLAKDPDLDVKVQAIVALHRIDPSAFPARDALLAISQRGEDDGLAAAAMEALGLAL